MKAFPSIFLGLGAFGCFLPATMAAESKVVAVLSRALAPYETALKNFQQDGRFAVQVVNLEGDMSKIGEIQAALAAEKPVAVLALGTEAVNAIKNSPPPGSALIFSMILDPMEIPGRKVSGVVMQIPTGEQFARLAKMLPGAKRVGVVYNPKFSKKSILQARDVVGQYGMSLMPIAVENFDEIPGALSNLTNDKVDVLWSVVDNLVAQPSAISQIIEHAHNEKVPFIGLSMYHVKAGALAAFAVDYSDLGKQTAELTAKVVAGEASNRIETPRKIVAYVNDTVQKQLGLNLSDFPDVQILR
ncbi:MAG: hypothetical protein HGA76_02415 [Candidatus Firestonebacteria bacterium]|nr:hypothetical protein [Candidatus Firestonebacteria bacterium]